MQEGKTLEEGWFCANCRRCFIRPHGRLTLCVPCWNRAAQETRKMFKRQVHRLRRRPPYRTRMGKEEKRARIRGVVAEVLRTTPFGRIKY